MDDMKIVNKKQLAKALGVCPNTVRDWVKKGILHKMDLPGCRFSIDQVRNDLLQKPYQDGYTFEDIARKCSSKQSPKKERKTL
jgi:uncharacterized protein YjcR